MQVHAKEAMPPCLTHFYVVCPPEQKLPVLRALIKRELGSAAGAKSSGDVKAGTKSGRTNKRETRGLVFALPTKSLEDIAASLDKALGGGLRGGGEESGSEAPPMAEFLREELGLNARVRILRSTQHHSVCKQYSSAMQRARVLHSTQLKSVSSAIERCSAVHEGTTYAVLSTQYHGISSAVVQSSTVHYLLIVR